MKELFKIIALVKPLALEMILAITLGVLGHLAAVLIIVIGAYAIVLLLQGSLNLVHLGVLLVVIALLRALFRYSEQNLNHYIAFKLLALLRHEIFAKLRVLAPGKLDKRDKGDLISLITSDIELLEVFYAHTISPVMIALIFDILIVVFISCLNPLLALVALGSYLVIGIVIPLYFDRKSADEALSFRLKSGELSSFVLETLRGIKEFYRYGYGDQRIKELEEKSKELKGHEKRLKDVAMENTALTSALIYLFDLAMLVVGGYLYLHDGLSGVSVLIATITLMSSFGPTVAIANLSSTLQNTIAASKRINSLLAEKPLIKEVKGREMSNFGDIKLMDVTFAYEDEKILKDLSLKFEKGKIIGIKGQSGIGKSTILKLIMRFYDPDKGQLTINNRDLKLINTHDLRKMSSYMRQEADLLADTIFNNLRIAKGDATLEEVKAACQKANIHDLIMSLEKGYDSKLSELGSSLSSGERQRLNLARVFLHDGDLILLDEPTSNLDSLSEGMILKTLKNVCKDKTIIVVSHRLSSLRIADEIIELEAVRAS